MYPLKGQIKIKPALTSCATRRPTSPSTGGGSPPAGLRSTATRASKREDKPGAGGAQPVPPLATPTGATRGLEDRVGSTPLAGWQPPTPHLTPLQALHDHSAGLKYRIWGQITAGNAPKCRERGADRQKGWWRGGQRHDSNFSTRLPQGCSISASHPSSGLAAGISRSLQVASV